MRSLALSIVLVIWAQLAQAGSVAQYNEDGDLKRPEGYREWVFIGSMITPNDMNFNAAYLHGFRYVYMDPESFAYWKKHGRFRTGTMIAQDVVDVGDTEADSGNGYFPGRYLALQVMVKDPKRYPESIWGFYGFGEPPYEAYAPSYKGMGELHCAGCHTRADHDWVHLRYYPVLLASRPKPTDGKGLFERNWTPASKDHASMGDGLGPLFNAQSCDACHPRGKRGLVTFKRDGEIDGDSYLIRVGVGEYGDPVYGRQIQHLAVKGIMPEGKPYIEFKEFKDEDGVVLRKPTIHVRYKAYGQFDSKTRLSGRISPSVLGNGAIDKIPVSVLEALEDPDDRDGDGISGRLNRIETFTGGEEIGRFGWKAANWNLTVQTAKAFRMDMGMSTPLLGPGWGECSPAQRQCVEAPHGARKAKKYREVSQHDMAKIEEFVASLALPKRSGDFPKGEKIFQEIGCAACHVPSLKRDDASDLPLFSNLLLHDMGPGLSDGISEGSATGAEWRTPPLAGLGELMRTQQPLLHDGRAQNVDQAIRWHGGEGQKSRDLYRALNREEKDKLMKFLGSL